MPTTQTVFEPGDLVRCTETMQFDGASNIITKGKLLVMAMEIGPNHPLHRYLELVDAGPGWVLWKGGGNPLPGQLVAGYALDGGSSDILKPGDYMKSEGIRWHHEGDGSDVIAYKPAPEPITWSVGDLLIVKDITTKAMGEFANIGDVVRIHRRGMEGGVGDVVQVMSRDGLKILADWIGVWCFERPEQQGNWAVGDAIAGMAISGDIIGFLAPDKARVRIHGMTVEQIMGEGEMRLLKRKVPEPVTAQAVDQDIKPRDMVLIAAWVDEVDSGSVKLSVAGAYQPVRPIHMPVTYIKGKIIAPNILLFG